MWSRRAVAFLVACGLSVLMLAGLAVPGALGQGDPAAGTFPTEIVATPASSALAGSSLDLQGGTLRITLGANANASSGFSLRVVLSGWEPNDRRYRVRVAGQEVTAVVEQMTGDEFGDERELPVTMPASGVIELEVGEDFGTGTAVWMALNAGGEDGSSARGPRLSGEAFVGAELEQLASGKQAWADGDGASTVDTGQQAVLQYKDDRGGLRLFLPAEPPADLDGQAVVGATTTLMIRPAPDEPAVLFRANTDSSEVMAFDETGEPLPSDEQLVFDTEPVGDDTRLAVIPKTQISKIATRPIGGSAGVTLLRETSLADGRTLYTQSPTVPLTQLGATDLSGPPGTDGPGTDPQNGDDGGDPTGDAESRIWLYVVIGVVALAALALVGPIVIKGLDRRIKHQKFQKRGRQYANRRRSEIIGDDASDASDASDADDAT